MTSTATRGGRVELHNIGLRYAAEKLILRDISLTVEPGETLVLLGPSGCGKSSLLRSINRLVIPQTGTVAIDGEAVTAKNVREMRRSIGYVIQSGGLFPHMTAAENIAVVLREMGVDVPTRAARVNELLELVRLPPAEYAARKPASLSGGEAQRVGIARALAARPRVLLMDEPFAALDPVVRASLQGEIRELVRRVGTTVIFVTHDVDEAIFMGDRIALLRDGDIVQCGRPFDVLRAPADAAAAEFLRTADRMRLLRTMRVGDLFRAGADAARVPPGAGTTLLVIDEDATLAEAVELLLQSDGREKLVVRGGTSIVGSLDFPMIAYRATAVVRGVDVA